MYTYHNKISWNELKLVLSLWLFNLGALASFKCFEGRPVIGSTYKASYQVSVCCKILCHRMVEKVFPPLSINTD